MIYLILDNNDFTRKEKVVIMSIKIMIKIESILILYNPHYSMGYRLSLIQKELY